MLGKIRVSRMIATFEGAAENALDLYQGEAVDLPFSVVDAVGAPVDLTTYTVHWRVKRTTADASYKLQKVSPTNITIDNATKGLGTVHVASADLATEDEGVYVHDMWIEDGSKAHITMTPAHLNLHEAVTTGLP
jgi:hypothetical protein